MSVGVYVMRQFARPHGRLAGLFGALMNRGNRLINQVALDALDLSAGQRVLDVGFGGGATIEILLGKKDAGFVGALDASEDVVRRAQRRFAPWLKQGRVTITLGVAENIPWAAGEFDRALSVNSLYYWSAPAQGVRELWRVLRPGGIIALGLRAKAAIDKLGVDHFKHLGYWSPSEREVEDLLGAAGFADIRLDRRRGGLAGDFVVFRATKPVA